MKNRIFLLIETKELTPGKFADEIGVERSTMSHIKSDRSKQIGRASCRERV